MCAVCLCLAVFFFALSLATFTQFQFLWYFIFVIYFYLGPGGHPVLGTIVYRSRLPLTIENRTLVAKAVDGGEWGDGGRLIDGIGSICCRTKRRMSNELCAMRRTK